MVFRRIQQAIDAARGNVSLAAKNLGVHRSNLYRKMRQLGMETAEEEEDEGLLFVGDGGKILCGFNGSHPRLIPQSRMDAYKQPPKTLPRSPGNC